MTTLIHVVNNWPVRECINDRGRVNVIGPGSSQARFDLDCPHGPVALVGRQGFSSGDLDQIEAELNARIGEVC